MDEGRLKAAKAHPAKKTSGSGVSNKLLFCIKTHIVKVLFLNTKWSVCFVLLFLFFKKEGYIKFTFKHRVAGEDSLILQMSFDKVPHI